MSLDDSEFLIGKLVFLEEDVVRYAHFPMSWSDDAM